MIYQKRLTFLQNQFILFLLTPVTRCIGHAWTSTDHFKWWRQKWFAQNGNLRLNGVCHISEQRDVLKDIHWISFVSFVMFLLRRLLILTWISELNLVILLNIIILRKSFLTCMSLNWSLSFMHWDINYVFGIKWKKRKCFLIIKYTVCFNLAWQWRYLTDKTGFLFIGTHCITTSYYYYYYVYDLDCYQNYLWGVEACSENICNAPIVSSWKDKEHRLSINEIVTILWNSDNLIKYRGNSL